MQEIPEDSRVQSEERQAPRRWSLESEVRGEYLNPFEGDQAHYFFIAFFSLIFVVPEIST